MAYVFPLPGYTGAVQLHWGSYPGGSDLFTTRGAPVVAMEAGTVESAGWDAVGGWNVTLRLDTGLVAYHAHLDRQPPLSAGGRVAKGGAVGVAGDTGNAQGTGVHLHLGLGPTILRGTGPKGGCGANLDGSPFDAVSILRAALNPAPPSGFDEDIAVAVMDEAARLRLPQILMLALAYGEGGLRRPFPLGDNGTSAGPFQVHMPVHGGTREQWENPVTAMRHLATNAPRGGWLKTFADKGGWGSWWGRYQDFVREWAPYAQGSVAWDADKARRCIGHGLDTLVLVLKAQKPPPPSVDWERRYRELLAQWLDAERQDGTTAAVRIAELERR